MIELEIQGLSPTREGLLIEVGRFVMAHGFTLQRQRLVQDHHGILLTMVVRGPSRGRKALEAALGAYERFISFQMFPFVDGEPKPHFAASLPRMAYTPPPAPPVAAPAPPPVTASATSPTDTPTKAAASASPDAPEPRQAPAAEPDFEFIQPTPRPPAAAPAAVAATPFVDLVPLGPDEPAVEKMLRALEYDYPKIVPQLLALQQSVAEAARESSLALAGKRTGSWVFRSEYLLDDGLDLREAIERIGVPALHALVEVDQQGTQLHIHDSPLCAQDGHSGCSFFGGFLEGLLGPAIAPGSMSIFPVCCRSYGADACVLELSD
ncbi:hypothetical protein EAH88_02685 [Rhodanobacter glycinis]|uniref:4-vinyl reductase 4VR domain-containing protein n=1 Tax=Rhodanobacter glycinis TaxID=582702 RepID=A0A502CEP3_9GAMM|nr:hypothetical protein [Rhodanobacter glycinis]TPG11448.1 hypothetical protein EAH88_02685 [Rhodanobacter glycinis]